VAACDEILAALRRAAMPAAPRPAIDGVGAGGAGAGGADLVARLAEAVAAVGGTLVRVPDRAGADAAVRALPAWREARRVASLVPGVGASTDDLATVADPHDLDGLDLVVLPAALAVAENGAAWIDGPSLPHHALVVVAEHMAVVVDAAAVVPDLHAAYATLDLAGRPRRGLFLAGPSKTAGIEQSLVIGAHGARSCALILVG
jgi:L-lactate dehydrogenase complex protein LldG